MPEVLIRNQGVNSERRRPGYSMRRHQRKMGPLTEPSTPLNLCLDLRIEGLV